MLIVIVNYRSTDLAIACLRTLEPEIAANPGVGVVVVENATGGDATARLEDAIRSGGWGGWCDLRPQRENLGFTGGNNVAIRGPLASPDPPDYVLLLNPDTLVEPGALRPLLDFMDAHPRAGVAGNQLLDWERRPGPSPFRFLGLASELDRGFQSRVVRKLLAPWLEPVHAESPLRVDWVSGACMMLRSEMLQEIGLLDEDFFTYFEDVDVCVRARDAGWETWYVPGSVVVHLEGGSTGGPEVERRPAFYHQARRRFFLKHFGAFRAALIDLGFVVGATVALLKSTLLGRSTVGQRALIVDTLRHGVLGSGFRLERVTRPASIPLAAPRTGTEGGTRSVGRRVLDTLPLGVWERLFPKDVVGLCYHVVSDEDLGHHKLYPYKSAAQFEADVAWASRHVLTYREVVELRTGNGRGRGGPNGIFFSFDDGYSECLDVVAPILRRHRVDAAFFVTGKFVADQDAFHEILMSRSVSRIETMEEEQVVEVIERLGIGQDLQEAIAKAPSLARRRFGIARVLPGLSAPRRRLILHTLGLDGPSGASLVDLCGSLGVEPSPANAPPVFLSPSQIRALHAEGFTIGAHSMEHVPLGSVDEERLEQEIVQSCAVVRDLTGQKRVPFAFPYGAVGVPRATLASILRRHEHVEILFDAEGFERDVPFMVQRVWVDRPSPGEGTNLPELLRREWSRRAAWYRGFR